MKLLFHLLIICTFLPSQAGAFCSMELSVNFESQDSCHDGSQHNGLKTSDLNAPSLGQKTDFPSSSCLVCVSGFCSSFLWSKKSQQNKTAEKGSFYLVAENFAVSSYFLHHHSLLINRGPPFVFHSPPLFIAKSSWQAFYSVYII